MRTETLVELHQARPFAPFSICLADGRRFDIRQPENLARTKTCDRLCIANADEGFEIVDAGQLAEIVPLKTRGRKRRGD